MILTLKEQNITLTPNTLESIFDLHTWLEEQAAVHNLRWLLAHADDGVIWGEIRGNKLYLSSVLVPPLLRLETLQQMRVFGNEGELLLWRSDHAWQIRMIIAGEGQMTPYYDETFILWGTNIIDIKDGFCLLQHGAQGLLHAPPLPAQKEENGRARIQVRHYIGYDDDGQALINLSRILSLEWNPRQGGKNESKA